MSDPVAYIRVVEGEPLPDVSGYAPYRAVVVLDGTYGDEWQNEASRWLIDTGCLYMMAWGDKCSSWDDSVDWAQIDKYPDGVPDAGFVMTTWHEKQPLIEVFWFARFCAHDPFGLIKHSLIVHVGKADRQAEYLALFEQSEDWIDPEEEG